MRQQRTWLQADPAGCVQLAAVFRFVLIRGFASGGEGVVWWGGAPLRQLQTMFQPLAEDALPSTCPLDGFLGSQEAVRCVGRLDALGSGPAVLEHG